MSAPVRFREESETPTVQRWWLRSTRRTPGIIAALTWLVGVIAIVSSLLPAEHNRIRYLTRVLGLPVIASATATAIAMSFGVLLVFLAFGLRRRKKRAWRAVVVVTAVVALTHILKGLDVEEATASLALLAVLLLTRKQFYALGDPTTRWYAARATVEMLIVAITVGMAGLLINQRQILGRPSLWQDLREVLLGFIGISGPLRFRHERGDDIVAMTLLAFGLLIAFVAAYLFLRSAQPKARLTADDETRLRELLHKHGERDSLGYFALRRDKSVVWSPTGKAAVTYRVVSGVALASADPIGDPEAWPGAINEFLELSRLHAWVPAVIGDSEQGATVYARYGLDALELGDEAIVDVGSFSLCGRPMRGVRQAVKRTERAGYTVRVRRVGDLAKDEMDALLTAVTAWRGGGVERGYSMALSRLGDPDDCECVIVTAELDGVLRGLLHFVPWGSDGLSLDLMRRDRTADNGLNELMIATLIESGGSLGVRRVSLNFAAFRSALERGERIGAGPILRMWRRLLVFMSRWWQIESLYRFNVKFRPDWEPRFLSFPTSRDLPRISLAALEAEAFIVRPRPVQRLLHRDR